MRTAITLLLTTALIAGCGGGDKTADFKKDFRVVNDQLLALGTEVGQAVGKAEGTPDSVLATEFTGFASRLREIRARIAKLDPPDDRKSQTEAMSSAVDRLIADLQGIGTAARNHTPDDARAAAVALVRDSAKLRTARRALAKATGAKSGS